jgi:hypothetical protein
MNPLKTISPKLCPKYGKTASPAVHICFVKSTNMLHAISWKDFLTVMGLGVLIYYGWLIVKHSQTARPGKTVPKALGRTHEGEGPRYQKPDHAECSFVAEKTYLSTMEKAPVNFNMDTMGKAVQAFVRSRAIRLGSFIAYQENGNIIKEDPRTGQKIIVQAASKK